jgi:hypothetical protein
MIAGGVRPAAALLFLPTAVLLLTKRPAWRPVGPLAALVSIAALLLAASITPAGPLIDAAVPIAAALLIAAAVAVAVAHRSPRLLAAGGRR